MAPRTTIGRALEKLRRKKPEPTQEPPSRKKTIATEHHTRDMVSQDDSPLIRLPAELRDAIYEFVFVGKATGDSECSYYKQDPRVKPPGILLACKQTYKESIGLFYANSTFHFGNSEHAIEYLTRIPTGRVLLIQDVRLSFPPPHGGMPGDSDCAAFWIHYFLNDFRLKVARETGIYLPKEAVKSEIREWSEEAQAENYKRANPGWMKRVGAKTAEYCCMILLGPLLCFI